MCCRWSWRCARLFEAPTVEKLGRAHRGLRRAGTGVEVPPLECRCVRQQLPLSYAQERLWFLEQLGLVGFAYNIPMALRLQGGAG